MNITFTKSFLETLEIAEELREEDKVRCISEMHIITAEYMRNSSFLAIYAKERGIPDEMLQEILVDLNNEFELSDEEVDKGWTFQIKFTNEEKTYKISKTVKETMFQAAENSKNKGNGMTVDIRDYIQALIQRRTYGCRIFILIEKYATVSREELKEKIRRISKTEKKSQQEVSSEPGEKEMVEQKETQKQLGKKTRPKKDEKAIPKKLEDCLILLNENVQKGEECEILGRDLETREVEKILLKTTKRNAILIGEPGVGKTAIVEKLVWDIVNEECPEQLKNQRVISLSVNGIIAGTTLRGDAEEKFKILTDFLEKNPDVILFIDEIHNILGAGSANETNMDLGNALKPILARGQVRVIGATTSYEYEKFFTRDPALKRRFEPVIVAEPKTFEVYPMIRNKIRKLEDSHEVLISEELANFCIYLASCYKPYVRNPDRTLDLIDTSMALANLEKTNMVTKDIILKNMEKSLEALRKTSLEIKESTAYHEAGHYVLGKFSKALANRKAIAVTIIPYEGKYMGANVLEPEDSLNTFQNKDYFVQLIASLYAGRVAEEMKTGYITAGARSDAEKATRLAEDYVTKYAMAEDFSRTRVYAKKDKDDTVYLTDEKLKQIDAEIDNLLKEGYELAEKTLYEHRKELDLISQELLNKNILSDAQITELLKNNEVK